MITAGAMLAMVDSPVSQAAKQAVVGADAANRHGSGVFEGASIRIDQARWAPGYAGGDIAFVVSMQCTNLSSEPVSAFLVHARLIVPGRSTPHGQTGVPVQIPSGIEPGETRPVEFRIPSMMIRGGHSTGAIMPPGCRLEVAELDPRPGIATPIMQGDLSASTGAEFVVVKPAKK